MQNYLVQRCKEWGSGGFRNPPPPGKFSVLGKLAKRFLHSHQPPVLHNYQATCKYIHTYSQHVIMATHIQLASGFRASACFHIIHHKVSIIKNNGNDYEQDV